MVWRGRPRPRLLTLIASLHAGEGARATQKLPSFARPGRVEDPSPHEPLRPECAVERPVLDRFGDVFGLYRRGAFQVGDGAGYL